MSVAPYIPTVSVRPPPPPGFAHRARSVDSRRKSRAERRKARSRRCPVLGRVTDLTAQFGLLDRSASSPQRAALLLRQRQQAPPGFFRRMALALTITATRRDPMCADSHMRQREKEKTQVAQTSIDLTRMPALSSGHPRLRCRPRGCRRASFGALDSRFVTCCAIETTVVPRTTS